LKNKTVKFNLLQLMEKYYKSKASYNQLQLCTQLNPWYPTTYSLCLYTVPLDMNMWVCPWCGTASYWIPAWTAIYLAGHRCHNMLKI